MSNPHLPISTPTINHSEIISATPHKQSNNQALRNYIRLSLATLQQSTPPNPSPQGEGIGDSEKRSDFRERQKATK